MAGLWIGAEPDCLAVSSLAAEAGATVPASPGHHRGPAVRPSGGAQRAASGPQRIGANEPWRRQRLARAYRACDERRRPRRACTLGTCWERFVD